MQTKQLYHGPNPNLNPSSYPNVNPNPNSKSYLQLTTNDNNLNNKRLFEQMSTHFCSFTLHTQRSFAC